MVPRPDPRPADGPVPGPGPGLGPLFADLEQQWLGLNLQDRAAAVADLGAAAYAEVTLAGRLHASVGREVSLTCADGLRVTGTIVHAGADCVVVGDWVVRTPALITIDGLADREVPEQARPVTAALGFGAVARRLAERTEATEATVVLADGTRITGRVGRVGADFVEVVRGVVATVVPIAAVAAVRGAR